MRPVNKKALNTAAKVLSNQVKTLEAQGYQDMYFTAQFFSGGRKQNGIERGNMTSIAKQVRDYVKSEEADTMTVEVFEEGTDKSIYRKKFSALIQVDKDAPQNDQQQSGFNGLNGYNGLGEVEFNALVDKRVEARELVKDYSRLGKEMEDLRTKYTTLEKERDELDAELKAKKNLEFYSGIIGAAFPGLAPLFSGTPLAQAAGYLAGTGDAQTNESDAANSDTQSISAMVAEFCNTLSATDASAMHMLCVVFEKDRSKIQSTLQQVMAGNPAT